MFPVWERISGTTHPRAPNIAHRAWMSSVRIHSRTRIFSFFLRSTHKIPPASTGPRPSRTRSHTGQLSRTDLPVLCESLWVSGESSGIPSIVSREFTGQVRWSIGEWTQEEWTIRSIPWAHGGALLDGSAGDSSQSVLGLGRLGLTSGEASTEKGGGSSCHCV